MSKIHGSADGQSQVVSGTHFLLYPNSNWPLARLKAGQKPQPSVNLMSDLYLVCLGILLLLYQGFSLDAMS